MNTINLISVGDPLDTTFISNQLVAGIPQYITWLTLDCVPEGGSRPILQFHTLKSDGGATT